MTPEQIAFLRLVLRILSEFDVINDSNDFFSNSQGDMCLCHRTIERNPLFAIDINLFQTIINKLPEEVKVIAETF